MAKYYVYTLAYPKSMGGAVFYVGKGTGNRVKQHEWEAKRGATSGGYHMRKHDIIRDIWERGEQVVKTIVMDTDDEQEALKHERNLIAKYGTLLVNVMYNTDVNPVGKTTNKILLSELPQIAFVSQQERQSVLEHRFHVAFERAKSANRYMVMNCNEEEKENKLARLNEAAERRLRRVIFRPEEHAQRIQCIVEAYSQKA